MEARGRALFNLLLMNWQENPSLDVEPWQIEDYRDVPLEELFSRLDKLGIPLNDEQFTLYAEKCGSPEELAETLWVRGDFQKFDRAYLLLFELWRRLLPEKQSLSIFCDELDVLIDQYDLGTLEEEEPLQNALSDLQKVLDEHADQGEGGTQVFREISLFCAHDLESFIYDYASEQIDEGEGIYASELVDGYAPYIRNQTWFTFLRIRLLDESSPDDAKEMLVGLLEHLREEPDFELLLEIARYLVNQGAIVHFRQAIHQARDWIRTEQDFQELLAISCEFYRLLDREEETHAMADMLKQRQGNTLEKAISVNDKGLQEYYQLFEGLKDTQ